MNSPEFNNSNAGGLVTLTSKQLVTVATHSGILTIKGFQGFYKGSGCGYESNYHEVDLWTRCINCFSNLVTDGDIMCLDEIDPI